MIRALGRAWVESNGHRAWRARRGRAPHGTLTEAQAAQRMLVLVRQHHDAQTQLEADTEARRRRGVTFRELAHEYLQWVEEVRGAKPSTIRGYRSQLAEPGQAYRRGPGRCKGQIMAALGDLPAREITTRQVEQLLRAVGAAGVGPRSVNSARQLVSAIFNYGMRESTYGLEVNPAARAERRTEPDRSTLAFYSSEEIEALARSLAAGSHRWAGAAPVEETEATARAIEDAQDAELVRIAAYTGLRRGELIALKWRDVDFPGHKLTVRRAVSAEVELNSTKSRRAREVPLPDQAAAALDRLSRRDDFISPDDYVFVNRFGRRIDGSALRRRFERARGATGLERLRFHDLRHTYGSLLVAGGVDLASVKQAMGHSRISTTERYLHARPARELADRFTKALASGVAEGARDRPRARPRG